MLNVLYFHRVEAQREGLVVEEGRSIDMRDKGLVCVERRTGEKGWKRRMGTCVDVCSLFE